MVKRQGAVEDPVDERAPLYPMDSEHLLVPCETRRIRLPRWASYTPAQGLFPEYCDVTMGMGSLTLHRCADHEMVIQWADKGHWCGVKLMSEIALRVTPWDDEVEVHAWPRFEVRGGIGPVQTFGETPGRFDFEKAREYRVVVAPPTWWERLLGITWERKIDRVKYAALAHVASFEAHKDDGYRRARAIVNSTNDRPVEAPAE